MKKFIAFLLSAMMFISMFVIVSPADSVNLIAGKTGVAVDGCATEGFELLTDGATGTLYWDQESDLYCIANTNIDATEWVGWAEYFAFIEYDLGAPTAITSVKTVSNGAPWDVLILTSEDGETWTKQSLTGNLQKTVMEEKTELIKLDSAVNVTAQYVRIGFGADNNHAIAISEIEIIGEGTAAEVPSTPEDATSDDAADDGTSAPAEESENEGSKEPATDSQPGDASDMIVFAVIALVAIAGSAVVIKSRG